MNGFGISKKAQIGIAAVVLLSVLLGTQTLGQAYAATSVSTIVPKRRVSSVTYTQAEKGLMIDTRVVLNQLPSPSFQELRQAGFTLVGVGVYSPNDEYIPFGNREWQTLAGWIKNVHQSGLRAFVHIQDDPTKYEVDKWITRAASLGVDVIHLDELIVRYRINELQLKSLIDAGLKVKPDLLFIVTEYSAGFVADAYAWTASYPCVRVATDNYDDKSRIDLGIQLAQQYGKKPMAWLIFGQGTTDFDCYSHLDEWITYVKQSNLDGLFWFVDHRGTWEAQWEKVAAF
jgi:hypothetical protein